MDLQRFERLSEVQWRLPPRGRMRVPAIVWADETLLRGMDDKVGEQLANVASLPGVVAPVCAMPDAHWGYGFPVGGVAAFDPDEGGVVSAGGVGFDISCGVRLLRTGVGREALRGRETALADALCRQIPAGVGSTGRIELDEAGLDAMLRGGAAWAVGAGWGRPEDLSRIEHGGRIEGADPARISERARARQRREMGTLGSGNHYLEVQVVAEVVDEADARVFGLEQGALVVTIHCGSRGLGHQVGTEFLREMAIAAPGHGIELPDRELACAPIRSPLGQRYLGAMRAAANCALANRQILTHLAREVFADHLPEADLTLLYDVSHNFCSEEMHAPPERGGAPRRLFVHRKGATRSLGPGAEALPRELRAAGQPVLIGGSMGTESWVLAGTREAEERAFASACHGAGRSMSRTQARKRWRGRELVQELATRGIHIRSPSARGVAEEAPLAYKDVRRVVELAERARLATRVARLEPVICVKG